MNNKNKTTCNNNQNKNTPNKNMPNQNSPHSITKQKQKACSTGTSNKSHDSRTQSGSNDILHYFDSANENDDVFKLQKSKKNSKRNHSSTNSPEPKKVKPLFITVNRFSPLSNEDTDMGNITNNHTATPNNLAPNDDQNAKRKLPPPIYVRGVLDFVGLRN